MTCKAYGCDTDLREACIQQTPSLRCPCPCHDDALPLEPHAAMKLAEFHGYPGLRSLTIDEDEETHDIGGEG